ncbi:MAG TPA: hypothetical protein DER02_07800 [Gammaproteobacteria bacterium]|nr:hypothetical protein [Gammaproteobacteria bacterium]
MQVFITGVHLQTQTFFEAIFNRANQAIKILASWKVRIALLKSTVIMRARGCRSSAEQTRFINQKSIC